ncbi:putative ribonuclease H-like domain-containing protein [Tanacetum coccineum]
MISSGEMKGIRGNLVLCQNLAYKIELLKEEETLIEVARNMLAGSLLPTTFWAEAVNTGCYVQNRVLVTMPHNNTSYELLLGRPPSISFMRPFRCHVTILNTLDPLGKFDEKADEGFFVGYSINSKAFRVFNTRTRKVEENLHITFLENKPNVVGSGPDWLFNIDLLTNSMNYEPVTAGNQTNRNAKDAVADDAGKKITEEPANEGKRNGQEKEVGASNKEGNQNVQDLRAELDNLLVQQKQADSLMPDLEDTADLLNTSIFSGAYDDEDKGVEADLNNLETTMNVSPIPTTRIHKDHPKDQITGDINLATQKRRMTKISEEHALDRSNQFPDKVYKVEKALYGLHQAPRAWYETLSTYLLENGFKRGTIDKTLFIKKDKGDILLVQVYVDDIIFGSTKKSLCVEFEQMMHKRFQMSSMGELTFFLRLQVKQKDDGIFISQDKYVVDILKKFDFTTVKTTCTPIEINKALLKDEEAEDVDVHLYRSMIGSLMYLIASRPDIMFVVCACARFQVTPKVSHLHAVKRIFRYLKGQPKLGLWYPRDSPFDLEAFSDSDYAGASLDRKSTTGGCQFLGKRLISWQCKKQTIVANSTTEAEYVAAANCCGQVLWIQNQMLDYGFNFMNTKIYIDNESTICIVKNPVFHSKTKHIEIRHHFIRDSYEKRLIQVIKIHTDHNVADLLTKAFDVSSIRDKFGNKTGSCKVNTARQAKHIEYMVLNASPLNQIPKRGQDTKIPQSGGPPKKVGDEAVHKELGGRMERAATTASSLEVEQDSGSGPRCQDTILGGVDAQTRFETTSKLSNDPPLLRVHILGSG